MNLYALFEERLRSALTILIEAGELPQDLETKAITVEPPRDSSHGDLATNAALVLAKQTKSKPRDVAEKIVSALEGDKDIEKIDIAGPGFINFSLVSDFWAGIVAEILRQAEDFGRSNIGAGRKVNIEYVSVNPTGPLHVGHSRGAVFGDALASLLEYAGHKVTREYYINDAGAQVDVLARSAYLRYREALGEDIGKIPDGLYPGNYLIAVGKALADKHGKELLNSEEAEWLPIVRQFAIDAMMDIIRDDLKKIAIQHEVFFSEQTLTSGKKDKVAKTINWLEEQGFIYEGRLPPPKGKRPEDWEDREQSLFRATDFGDNVDRALRKADGSYTYFAADMAYHRDKIDRGFDELINVWGADHAGHVRSMKAAVKALSDGKVNLDVKICQLVNLFRAGIPIKMSKRSGTFVTVGDLIDEVGPDPVRFMMLYRKNDAPLDFDFVKVLEQSRDNPVFYVQYAHARAHSVFRNAHNAFPKIKADGSNADQGDVSRLDPVEDLPLMKQLGQFPRVIEAAATAHEPHRLAFYLYDLAAEFHSLWNRGKELPHLRFIHDEDEALTMSRIALVAATAHILASGLRILGVNAIREMR